MFCQEIMNVTLSIEQQHKELQGLSVTGTPMNLSKAVSTVNRSFQPSFSEGRDDTSKWFTGTEMCVMVWICRRKHVMNRLSLIEFSLGKSVKMTIETDIPGIKVCQEETILSCRQGEEGIHRLN